MKDTNHGAAYDAVFPTLMSAVYNVHLIQTHVILHIYVKNVVFIVLQFYLSRVLTTVAPFQKPNTIPLCFSIDLVLNFLLSWLLVLLPSTFSLGVLFSFSSMVVLQLQIL